LDGADRPLTPVLVGPTGVGKTAVAAALAARMPLTVISADARQIYRGLDIGTAKPVPDLLARVPHLGIDVIGPGDRYSAGRFARDAAGWLAEVRSAGRTPLVVGGTGLYIRALVDGLFREPPLDPVRRDQLRTWAERLGGGELSRWAGRLDRDFGGGGSQRAARAIEVALLTGRPLSWWQRSARETGVMRPWYIHLTLPRETLQRRDSTASGIARSSRISTGACRRRSCERRSSSPRGNMRNASERGFAINWDVRRQTSALRQMRYGVSMRPIPLSSLRPALPIDGAPRSDV